MTVSELIEVLKTKPQDLQVIYKCCSEHVLLGANKIKVEEHCEPRADGWVHELRPDKPKKTYLVFPGN